MAEGVFSVTAAKGMTARANFRALLPRRAKLDWEVWRDSSGGSGKSSALETILETIWAKGAFLEKESLTRLKFLTLRVDLDTFERFRVFLEQASLDGKT
jgi:hypothetical protein